MNSDYVYLHGYYNKNPNSHKFTWNDMSDFGIEYAKFTIYAIIHWLIWVFSGYVGLKTLSTQTWPNPYLELVWYKFQLLAFNFYV